MKKFSVEFKWAAICTVLAIGWMYCEKLMGYHDQKIATQLLFTNLFSLVVVFIYYLAIKEKKNLIFNHQMTWKEGFYAGCFLTLMITIFYPMVQYIAYTQISPQYFSAISDYMISSGKMNVETALHYFTFDNFLKQAAFNNLSVGVVTAAAIAYFIQTKPAVKSKR